MAGDNRGTDTLRTRATALYEGSLKAMLEPSHRDEFIAIEPDSGDYYLGPTLTEAVTAARAAHPNRLSFVMRIGHRAALHIGEFER